MSESDDVDSDEYQRLAAERRARFDPETTLVGPVTGPEHNHLNEGIYGGCPACGTDWDRELIDKVRGLIDDARESEHVNLSLKIPDLDRLVTLAESHLDSLGAPTRSEEDWTWVQVPTYEAVKAQYLVTPRRWARRSEWGGYAAYKVAEKLWGQVVRDLCEHPADKRKREARLIGFVTTCDLCGTAFPDENED